MDAVLPQPGFLFTILSFALVIGVLVTIHEFGHYLAGRWFGVKADTFSIGFGRELAGFTDRRGTRWKLAALPLGGYVKFAGDANAASMPGTVDHLSPDERARTLNAKPVWQRAVIIAAGPLTNFLFAILIFAALYMSYGRPFTPAILTAVEAGSPAQAGGLRAGDRIVELDGGSVTRFEDLTRAVAINTGTPIAIAIERDGVRRDLVIAPRAVDDRDRFGNEFRTGRLGVQGSLSASEQLGPLRAVAYATKDVILLVPMMVEGIVQVVTGDRSVKELGGPLKIAQFSGQQASLGPIELVQFVAFVSINLGFINLLPIPVLDGGHLLFYAIEGVRRRPLGQRAQELAFMSGFAALMSFMVFVTWNDLSSFGVWKHLAGLVG